MLYAVLCRDVAIILSTIKTAKQQSSSAKQLFYGDSQGPAPIFPNPNQCQDVPINVHNESHLSNKQEQIILRTLNAKDATC